MILQNSFISQFIVHVLLGVISAGFFISGCQSMRTAQRELARIEEPVPVPSREFRAAWIATVANIDWPSEPGLPVDKQKAELRAQLNRAAALQMNAVILQVRPAADALYDSPYEPWSAYLTGKMGQAPEPYYDPLAFAVREAHRRGLELHAWFNPFRAHHPADTSEIASGHVSRTHPELVISYGDYLWLDPGLPGARAHTHRVILDVVERYDIDGVHFDDYFYPYPSYGGGADFPDSTSWQQARRSGETLDRGDWRRQNIDRLIRELYRDIKKMKPYVKFGISPFGIWRPGYPEQTTGFDAYAELYADARRWLREGWIDYFTPQIYYQMDQTAQPYPIMLQWWTDQNKKNRHIWPGLFTSRVASTSRKWPVQEITGQMYTARAHPGVSGTVHFSMRALMENPEDLTDRLAAGPYATPALVPTSSWLDDNPPARPAIALSESENDLTLSIEPAGGEAVRWWVVYMHGERGWTLELVPGARRDIVLGSDNKSVWPDAVAVAAVDRAGNEGAVSDLIRRHPHRPDRLISKELKPRIVPHNTWADQSPRQSGYHANAVRRNLGVGDTLRFRDLTVVLDGMRQGKRSSYSFHRPWGVKYDTPDTARFVLQRNEVREVRTVPEGEAFNWYGYHFGVLSVNPLGGVLAGGLTELEVGTIASMPVGRAAVRETGDALQRLRVPHRIRHITLHHSGSQEPLTPDKDPVKLLRDLQSWGAEDRNWWDLPYHFLIGLDGTVYEGRDPRYAGETNTQYDPRGHLLISVLGNYNKQKPTAAQLDAIADLMAWAVVEYDIPLQHIGGHGDWADTSCPGRYLQSYLEDGTFLRAVQSRLNRFEELE